MRLLLLWALGGVTMAVGFTASWAGLIRLGWQRHHVSPFDLRFFHLDWVLHLDAPYWASHIANLAFFGWAVIVTTAGFYAYTGSTVKIVDAAFQRWAPGRPPVNFR